MPHRATAAVYDRGDGAPAATGSVTARASAVGAVVALVLVSSLGLGLGATAAVAAPCPATAAWLRGCRLDATPTTCAGAVAVVRFTPDGAPALDVELRADGRGFLTAGTVGLSPVVEVDDWGATPSAWRDAVAATATCARASPPPFEVGVERPAAASAGAPARWPVRGLLGLMLLVVAGWRGRRRLCAAVGRAGWGLVASVPVVAAARALYAAPAFAHPNGQGPIWIDFALCEPSTYGPGYAELFGWAARAAGTAPEAGVFLAMAALAALAPAATFLAARLAGGGRWVPGALALAVAVDPVALRLAGSEHYAGAIAALIGLAVVAALLGAVGDRATRALAIVAAGLLAAQAARVHAMAWAPVALVPLVALAPSGSWRARGRRTATVAAGYLATVAVAAGPAIAEVLGSRLVREYRGGALGALIAVGPIALLLLVAALAALVAGPRRGAVAAILCGGALAVAQGLAAPQPDMALQWQAHLRLYAPIALVGVAVALGRPRGPAPIAPLLALAVVLVAGVHAVAVRGVIAPTTDALEQRWALSWRGELTADDRVLYVERAGDRVLRLPLSRCLAAHPRSLLVQGDAPPPPLPTTGRLFYVETSLCSTPEGAPRCAATRAQAAWRRLDGRTLPARPSDYQPYPATVVPVWRGLRDPAR
jgi:hypothetical protein